MGRLAELSKEEKAKLGQVIYTNSNVTPEWMIIAEFGGYFGLQGVYDIIDNKIDRDVVEVLVEAQRKLHAKDMLDIAEAVLAATAAAQSGKKASNVFTQLTRKFTRLMKVKE